MPKRTVYLTPPSLLRADTVWGRLLPRPWRHSGKAGSCCGVAWRERKGGREGETREGGKGDESGREGRVEDEEEEGGKGAWVKGKKRGKEPMRGKRRAAGEREEKM